MSPILHFKYQNETCKLTASSEDLTLLNTVETPRHTWNSDTPVGGWEPDPHILSPPDCSINKAAHQTSPQDKPFLPLHTLPGLDPKLHQADLTADTLTYLVWTGWFLHRSYLLIKRTQAGNSTTLSLINSHSSIRFHRACNTSGSTTKHPEKGRKCDVFLLFPLYKRQISVCRYFVPLI